MGEIIEDFAAGVRTFKTLKETIDEAQKQIHSDSVYESLNDVKDNIIKGVKGFTDAISSDICESLGQIQSDEKEKPK